jgi:hypothetical protein
MKVETNFAETGGFAFWLMTFLFDQQQPLLSQTIWDKNFRCY